MGSFDDPGLMELAIFGLDYHVTYFLPLKKKKKKKVEKLNQVSLIQHSVELDISWMMDVVLH